MFINQNRGNPPATPPSTTAPLIWCNGLCGRQLPHDLQHFGPNGRTRGLRRECRVCRARKSRRRRQQSYRWNRRYRRQQRASHKRWYTRHAERERAKQHLRDEARKQRGVAA